MVNGIMDTNQQGKNPIEALSKEELISKYRGLLGIAKKAKQVKDELAEENRLLKETLSQRDTQRDADRKSLLAMKEMIDEFTENKLKLVTQLSELEKKSKMDDANLTQLNTANESLKRQLYSLERDNDALLKDIDGMDQQLKQVNVIGIEQKKHLSLLEHEVAKLKEFEKLNIQQQDEINNANMENKIIKEQLNETTKSLSTLRDKYEAIKTNNSEQRQKFNALKERFVDVYRKLKQLKKCRQALLETHHEYSEAITCWQAEIIEASRRLCTQMNALKAENKMLLQKLEKPSSRPQMTIEEDAINMISVCRMRLRHLQLLADEACKENEENKAQLLDKQHENRLLKEQLIKINLSNFNVSADNRNLKVELPKENNLYSCESGLQQSSNLKTESKQLQTELLSLEYKGLAAPDLDTLLKNSTIAEETVRLLQENRQLHDDIQQMRLILNAMETEKIEQLNQDAFERRSLAVELGGVDYEEISELNEMRAQQKMDKQTIDTLQMRYEQKEFEYNKLLGEMRALNEALKMRGDVISRQQCEIQQMSAKLLTIESELKDKCEAINDKDMRIMEIRNEIETAHEQIKELRTNCAMSNEPGAQKLIAESNEQQQQQQQQKLVVQQSEEETTARTKLNDIDAIASDESHDEERYNKLRLITIRLKKKLQEQIADATADMEDQQREQNKLRASNERLEIELEEQKKRCDVHKQEIQKLNAARKQANVLNLEIEAAEKSLSELSNKLASKTTELESLQSALHTKEQANSRLCKEIELLESAKADECMHSKQLKDQIDLLQSQLKDALHSKQRLLDASNDLQSERDRLDTELGEVREQLEINKAEKMTESAAATAKREQLQLKYLALQTDRNRMQAQLESSESRVQDLNAQFEDYKRKAQTVLRNKTQNRDSPKERELEEELLALRANEKQLYADAEMYREKLVDQEKQLKMLKEDNTHLQRRNAELAESVNELRRQHETITLEQRQQLEQQQAALKQQRLQIEQLHICHKEQLQQSENNYLRQLEAMEKGCQHNKLQHQQYNPHSHHHHHQGETIRQSTVVGATSETLPQRSNISETSNDMELLLMEREDAEGSSEETAEIALATYNRKISTGSSSHRSRHDFMPLEELLSAPMSHIISDTVITITSNSFRHQDQGGPKQEEQHDDQNEQHKCKSVQYLQMELQTTKENLRMHDSRLRHLTTLLTENEQDLAKLTQMNDMLKEELRRQERTLEREKHMHNSEYLKNIIIKFLTLNNGDERARLVPVMNAILKLSRSETEMLTCVARGQKVITEINSKSWSNFLSSWTNNNNN